jgi:hypothetical protein
MYAPKNNPSVHVASALARQLGACGLFRCDYILVFVIVMTALGYAPEAAAGVAAAAVPSSHSRALG